MEDDIVGTRVRESSWSGSENNRREQGICLPPKSKPVQVPRYRVPAGTKLAISKLTPLRYRDYTTQRDLVFERHEGYQNGLYTFRELGYLIRVERRHVIHREDER